MFNLLLVINFFGFAEFGVFMISFCEDCDILKYEGVLFSDLYFSWQILCQGLDGELSGTTFTVSSDNFVVSGVEAGGVIYLRNADGTLDGAYEIVSVESETELTVSVIRCSSEDLATGPGDASSVSYRVSTFVPQARQVFLELTQYFGIGPGDGVSEIDADDIVDTEGLRMASVYAVIAGIYATLASREDSDKGFWKKSLHYQRLFEKVRERCRISFDVNGDGSDDRSAGGSIKLVRE
jgi:hypothetical protein